MKIRKILSFVCIIIIIIGCSKDDSPTSPNTTSFKLNFVNGYNSGQGWVILHSSDGTTSTTTKQFFGNATVDFGEITEERVTFTFIFTREYSSWKDYLITSYILAPTGEWTFDGRDFGDKGSIEVNMTFPNGEYDQCFLGTSDVSSRRSLSSATSSYSFNFPVFNLNFNNTINLYGSVYNYDNDIGYCGWKLDEQFNIGGNNQHDLNLTTTLSPTNLTSNKLIDYVSVYALIGNNLDRLRLFYEIFSNKVSTAEIFFPETFPANKFITYCGYADGQISYSYRKIDTKLTENISIPSGIISASFNANTNSYENISYSGNVDEISAGWSYFDFNNEQYFSWIVYASKNETKLQRPILPNDVVSQISNFNIANMERLGIGITDFNTSTSMDDIIKMIYKSGENFYNTHTEYYFYVQK